MNPTSSAHLPQAVAQPAIALNAAAAPPKTNAAERKRVFFDAAISEAIGGGGVHDADLTALLREVDRLEQHWPDEVRGLVLAEDISPKVRQMLTAAIERAGLTVIEYQPSSCSFHVHATEMKRPPPGDMDDVVGPEVPSAPARAVNALAAAEPSRSPRENLNAIDALLNAHCTRALMEGGATSYTPASRARDAVMLAVVSGAASVAADLPADVVRQLAELGLRCRANPPALQSPPKAAKGKDRLEKAHAVAVAERPVDEQQPAAVDMELLGKGLFSGSPKLDALRIEKRKAHKGRDLRADLHVALTGSDAAGVQLAMCRIRQAGVSPDTLCNLLWHDNCTFHALEHGDAAVVTALMDGLQGAGLSRAQLGEVFSKCSSSDDSSGSGVVAAMAHGHAAAVTAFMDGLKKSGVTALQLADIVGGPAKRRQGFGGIGSGSDGKVSPLEAAMSAGHADAAVAYMRGVVGMGLSKEQIGRLTLLAAAPALANGHAAAVTAFIRCLKTLGFGGREIVDPFGKYDRNEAINDAIAEGHVAAVTAFIEGLIEAGFNGTQIAKAMCPPSYSLNGLARAMTRGNAASVTAFMELMKVAGVPAEDLDEILIYLGPNPLNDRDRRSHGLIAALSAGSSAAVSAFMEGLPGWGLSPQQVHRVVAVNMPSTDFRTVSQLTQTAEALEAYRDGLLLLEQHRLITAKERLQIDAQLTPLIQKLCNG